MHYDRHVYIFTPSYTGKPPIDTLHGLLEAAQSIAKEGWGVKFKFTVGDALIHRSRNAAVADVLWHPEYTDLIMVDDDLVWEPGAMVRLLSHPVDVVAGLYPKRADPLQFPTKILPGLMPDGNGLLEMKMVPAGFLRMTRACLQQMVAHYHTSRCYRDNLVPGGRAWALFMHELRVDPDEPDEEDLLQMWGEDFTFCRLWREIGGRIYGDTLLRFQHIGRKSFDGCFAEHIPGYLESSASPDTPEISTAA